MKTDGRFLKAENLTEEKLEKIKALNELAGERGESLAAMALKWVLRKNEVCSVLVGASKPCQIEENIKATEGASLSEEELKMIDSICR